MRSLIPDWKNVLAALASAILLIGAFPDFEFWFLAWFALVPLMWAVEREKESVVKSFVLGWIFGTVFFFGTCWWLTFAPITYAGFPWPLAYFLMFGVTVIVGIFPAMFAAILATLLRRFGSWAFLAAPFVWVFTEFLRYWLTGNNWNALGYSQALLTLWNFPIVLTASIGGVQMSSWMMVAINVIFFRPTIAIADYFWDSRREFRWTKKQLTSFYPTVVYIVVVATVIAWAFLGTLLEAQDAVQRVRGPWVVSVQPNVPMSDLTLEKWRQFRQRHVVLAESTLAKLKQQQTTNNEQSTTVIFPESPMNFMYEDDPETKQFIDSFASRHNVSVLFNSAEPDKSNGKFYNSAVMVDSEGREIAQYDKIYLLPFGEAVPSMLEGIVPGFVGNFSYGREYDLLPVGDAKAGVMICFESHFGQLSREYVRNGADVIIEMTNDGYLGPTPVLRQHLANAVFRAVETNRPVLRVTNVGITAYINEKGEILDPATPYQEDTRIWSVSKSDGSQTFYVKYGDWFAWLSSVVTIGLLLFGVLRKRADLSEPPAVASG